MKEKKKEKKKRKLKIEVKPKYSRGEISERISVRENQHEG